MKAKIILLILTLFLSSLQFFGQGINITAIANNKTFASLGNATNEDSVNANYEQTYYKSAEEIKEELSLQITCDANSYSDEALIIFNNSDPTEGSPKFYSMYASAPELWSIKNGNKYSINFMGELYSANVVPLTVKAGIVGNYTLTASRVESFGSNTEVSLEDLESGTITNLGITPSYTFPVSAPATIANRFYLHFLNITSIHDQEAAQCFNIYTVDRAIAITSLKQQSGKITVFDIQGRTIAIGRVEAGATNQIDIHGNTGVYIVRVLSGKGISNTKILVK